MKFRKAGRGKPRTQFIDPLGTMRGGLKPKKETGNYIHISKFKEQTKEGFRVYSNTYRKSKEKVEEK